MLQRRGEGDDLEDRAGRLRRRDGEAADGPQDPRNTNAWFIAFAPASQPRVAVAVMLVGAGQGGARAAPVARRVLQAAL